MVRRDGPWLAVSALEGAEAVVCCGLVGDVLGSAVGHAVGVGGQRSALVRLQTQTAKQILTNSSLAAFY